MKTLLIVLLVLAVAAGAVYVATKYFKAFKDLDKDGIPDVVEDKYEDVKNVIEDAKEIIEKAKAKVGGIVEEVKDLPKKVTRRKPGRSAKN